MDSEAERLRPELQAILDDFAKIRNAYVAFRARCEAQDEMLSLERERSTRMRENLDKVTKACLSMEKVHKSAAEDTRKENEDLRKSVAELRRKCERLSVVHVDQNASEERVFELQDEIEVLKSQLAMQEEKYKEDIAALKNEHSDEINNYKMLLKTAKQKQPVRRNTKEKKKVKYPAVTNSPTAKRKNTQSFRWPSLDIEVINSTPENDNEEPMCNSNEQKKRKLFHEERDVAIDIL